MHGRANRCRDLCRLREACTKLGSRVLQGKNSRCSREISLHRRLRSPCSGASSVQKMNDKRQQKSAYKWQDNERDLPDRQASREFQKSHQCQSQQCRTRRGLFLARSRAREIVDCRRGRGRGRSSPQLKRSPKFVGEFVPALRSAAFCDSGLNYRRHRRIKAPRVGANPRARKKRSRRKADRRQRTFARIL